MFSMMMSLPIIFTAPFANITPPACVARLLSEALQCYYTAQKIREFFCEVV